MSLNRMQIRLAPGRDGSAREGHPWVLHRAIAGNQPLPDDGAIVNVAAADGSMLGVASYSSKGDIALRFFNIDHSDIDSFDLSEDYLVDYFKKLSSYKEGLIEQDTDSYRLVNGEADGFPGLLIDRYSNLLNIQIYTKAADNLRTTIVAALKSAFDEAIIAENSNSPDRAAEGLGPVTGLISENAPKTIIAKEGSQLFTIDPLNIIETSPKLYLRDSRSAILEYGKGKSVLNIYSHCGASSIALALAGAASSVNIDNSSLSLDAFRENISVNGLKQSDHETINSNIIEALEKITIEKASFDIVILNPPAIIERRADMGMGSRNYHRLNSLALGLTKNDGMIISSSISPMLEEDQFRSILVNASKDPKKRLRVIKRISQPIDFTMRPTFPEGINLKCWHLGIG